MKRKNAENRITRYSSLFPATLENNLDFLEVTPIGN